MHDQVASLDLGFPGRDPLARLKLLRSQIDGRIVFTTSFGIEYQYLTDLIFTHDLAIEVVTLDTGRLFPETYAVWTETERKYGRKIRAYYPGASALETLVETQGIDGQYDSVAQRKTCCEVRKVAPLRRALEGASAWVTGLRADQSSTRRATAFVSFDPSFAILKANPLVDAARDQIVREVETRGVPVNALHAQGYPSIGCAPCTRAIRAGEDERAGRWWWEQDAQKECGLHLAPDGKIVARRAAADGDSQWAV